MGSSNYIRKEAHPVTEIQPFTFPETGQPVRTVTIDGEPWWVANDACAVLGIANVGNVLARLDRADVYSIRIADGTPGNPNRAIVNESGLYDMILDSRKPEARAFRRWITAEVIPAIRRTGRYETAPREMTKLEALQAAIESEQARIAAEARIAELEPAAASWNALADATGDYAVADAAKILTRGGIPTGRDRLFATLHGLDWTYRQGADGRYRAKQYAIERGWLAELPKTHTHPRTGEQVLDPPQIRVTVKGLHELRLRLLPPMDIPPLFPAA